MTVDVPTTKLGIPQSRPPADSSPAELIDDSGLDVVSYAGQAARDRFIEAMAGQPVAALVTVHYAARAAAYTGKASGRLDRIQAALPGGVQVQAYPMVKPSEPAMPTVEEHLRWWQVYSAGLNGLIAHGNGPRRDLERNPALAGFSQVTGSCSAGLSGVA